MKTKQPLKLADKLDYQVGFGSYNWEKVETMMLEAAAELRRLHEANEAFSKRQEWWNERMFKLEAENEALRAALRQHIRTYQVDDQHWAPEQEADRLMELALARAGEKT